MRASMYLLQIPFSLAAMYLAVIVLTQGSVLTTVKSLVYLMLMNSQSSGIQSSFDKYPESKAMFSPTLSCP
jgi:hypothetical protein